jgi:hypothetical protein
MSSRQAVVLASRVVCVILIFWVVVNLVDLPTDIFALHRYWKALGAGSDERYAVRYYSLLIDATVLRTALELFFAGVFYRCGPRISRFFTDGVVASEVSD